MNKAVFIDRDGVINSDVGHYYIYRLEDFVLNDGLVESLKLWRDAGFIFIIITNQGGINKGEYSKSDVELIHQKLRKFLSNEGLKIEEIYYCPHHDKFQKCLCRKPENLNIEKGIARFNIDRSQSWMIGDSPRDIAAGQASGLQTLKLDSNQNMLPLVQEILREKETVQH